MKKINVKPSIKFNKNNIIFVGLCLIALAVILICVLSDRTVQYLVNRDRIEQTEILTAFIIKNEEVIKKDTTQVLVPVATEGERIAKDSIIATYKGGEYKDYEEKLSQMDKEILDKMQHLPTVYSSEIEAIEKTIYSLLKQSIGETSYNKMQEYKQKINNNVEKRAMIIGELSPDGAEIKTLISKRNAYEEEIRKSNNNILSPIPGVVSYSTDGLEGKLKLANVQDLSYEDIVSAVKDNTPSINNELKVVNNYEAYLVVKAYLDNLKYIKEGYTYTVRLIEQENYEFDAVLEKCIQKDDGIEIYFKVTNGVEKLAKIRQAELEVVWNYKEGLIVPIEALNKYDNIDAYYVKTLKYLDYENIPVKIRIQNDSYAIVTNYETEELEGFGLESEYSLKLYDRIIIENN